MTDTAHKSVHTGHRRAGYLASIIINIILIFVFNNLQNWGVPFLTSRYSGVLWAIDLSLGASILVNFLNLIFNVAWLRHLGQLILLPISIFATFMILAIFPFTFAGESWAFWVRVALIVIMAASGIGFIVELFKLILGKE
jgi:hypothetical protein